MIKIAVYGKGGIGKSTTVSNVAAALAEKGMTVMQIGCDPKADSTIQLRHGREMRTVLDLYNEKKQNLKLEDMTTTGYQGVICVEAGGPTPGLGCAGRGIITALEKQALTRPINRILSSMMFLVMLSVAVFPCRCEKAMQTKSLSSLPEKIWRFMPEQTSPWRCRISKIAAMHLLAALF